MAGPTLGDAVIEVEADTKRLGPTLKAGATVALKQMASVFRAEAARISKQFGDDFNKGGFLKGIKTFDQLGFSFAKAGASLFSFTSLISPTSTALAGLAASAVAVGGALGQAAGAAIPAAGALSALGFAGATAAVALSDVIKALGSGKEAKEAFGALKGNAKETTKVLLDMKDRLGELRDNIQEPFFAGVAEPLKEFGKVVIPDVEDAMIDMSGVLNGVIKDVLHLFTGMSKSGQLGNVLNGLVSAFREMAPFITDVVAGLLNIFEAAIPQTVTLSSNIADVGKSFRNWTEGITESGKLNDFLTGAMDIAGGLIGIIGQLGGILVKVFGAGADQGASLLDSLEKGLTALNDVLGSAEGQGFLEGFFGTIMVLKQAVFDLGSVIKPVLKGLADVFVVLQPALEDVRAALLPVVQIIANQLGAALSALAPVIGIVAAILVDIIEALTPLAPLILPIVAGWWLWNAAIIATNIALSVTPLGAIVIGLAALVVAVALVVKHFDTFKAAAEAVFGFLMKEVTAAIDFVTEHWKTILLIFTSPLDRVLNWLNSKFDLLGKLKTIITAVVNFVTDHWKQIVVGLFTGGLGLVLQWVANKFDLKEKIGNVVSAVVNWVTDHWKQIVVALFTGGLGLVLQWVVNKFNLLDKVSNIVGKVVSWVKSHWKEIVLGLFTGGLVTVLSWITNKFNLDDKIENVLNAAQRVVERVMDAIKNAFDRAVTGIQNVWDRLMHVAAKPINFVIEWVYMKGIRKVVNALPDPIPDLPEVGQIPSHFQGGYTGNGPLKKIVAGVHGREYVINAKSTAQIERTNPGFLDHLNKMGVLPGHAAGGRVNPMSRVYVDGEPLTAMHAAQLVIAGRLMGVRQHVIQGSWQAPTSYSGTSHTGPGVADTSPGSFRAQYVQRRAGIAAWARNIPGAHYAGSGAHVHGVSMFSAPGNSQLAAYRAGGDGLGGSDYGARPSLLPGLQGMLKNFGQLAMSSLGGILGSVVDWKSIAQDFGSGIGGIFDKIARLKNMGGWAGMYAKMLTSLVNQIKNWGFEKLKALAEKAGQGWKDWAHGLVPQFHMDQGGTIPPGWSAVYNGTGRNETLRPTSARGGYGQVDEAMLTRAFSKALSNAKLGGELRLTRDSQGNLKAWVTNIVANENQFNRMRGRMAGV